MKKIYKRSNHNWMYIGTLQNYQYYNYDIDDLLVFLKPFAKKKIWLIDNFMEEFHPLIPREYDIVIIGIFGERFESRWLTKLMPVLQNKKVIILTSQEIVTKNSIPSWCDPLHYSHPYIDDWKIFYIEHLHKSIKFVFNMDLTIPAYPTAFKPLKERKNVHGLYNNRVDFQKLIVFAMFVKYCGKDSLFSFADFRKFDFDQLDEYLTAHHLNDIVDINLLKRIIKGPRFNAESLINLESKNRILAYYNNQDQPSINDNAFTEIPWDETLKLKPDMFDVMCNWVVETEIYYTNRAKYLTEKTLKPIMSGTPFVLLSNNFGYSRLERLGFNNYQSIFKNKDIFFTSIQEKLLAIEQSLKKINKDFLFDNAQYLEEAAKHNIDWFYNKFYAHCERLNADVIEEISEYINDN